MTEGPVPGDTRETVYPFERKKRTRRQREEAEAIREILGARLGLPALDTLPPEVRDLLLKYTTACHLNIAWYQSQREREIRLYRGFFALTVLLVAGTPAAVTFLSTSLDASLAPLVTAVLAGVFGTLKSLAAILEQRKLVGLFWKAEADLKTDLYAFEDRWRGKVLEEPGFGEEPVTGVRVKKDFIRGLHLQIQKAEQTRREEQDKFFSRFDRVPFDVTEVISGGTRRAEGVVKTFSSSEKSPSELEGEVERARLKLSYIEQRLAAAGARLAALEGDTTTLGDTSRQVLVDEIERLHALRFDTETEISEKLARVGRLHS